MQYFHPKAKSVRLINVIVKLQKQARSLLANNLHFKIKRALILPEAKHSDHCPVLVEIK